MRTTEQCEILGTFHELLAGPTGDGGGKRAAGIKPSWKVDASHWDAAMRHIGYYQDGEQADRDSGCHPLAHAAWRLLAVAYQDLKRNGLIDPDPDDNTTRSTELDGQTAIDDFIDSLPGDLDAILNPT